MRTVRLPIYDEDGFQEEGYLEVNVPFFLPPTAGIRSAQARLVLPEKPVEEPMAEWEKELLRDTETEAIDKAVAEAREYNENKPEEAEETEWRDLEGIPTKFFEINRSGDIRHKSTGKIMDLKMDADRLKPCVKLIINREEYWIDGKGLADKMWKDAK